MKLPRSEGSLYTGDDMKFSAQQFDDVERNIGVPLTDETKHVMEQSLGVLRVEPQANNGVLFFKRHCGQRVRLFKIGWDAAIMLSICEVCKNQTSKKVDTSGW